MFNFVSSSSSSSSAALNQTPPFFYSVQIVEVVLVVVSGEGCACIRTRQYVRRQGGTEEEVGRREGGRKKRDEPFACSLAWRLASSLSRKSRPLVLRESSNQSRSRKNRGEEEGGERQDALDELVSLGGGESGEELAGLSNGKEEMSKSSRRKSARNKGGRKKGGKTHNLVRLGLAVLLDVSGVGLLSL